MAENRTMPATTAPARGMRNTTVAAGQGPKTLSERFVMTAQEEVINALANVKTMSKSLIVKVTGRHHLAIFRATQDLVTTGHIQYSDIDATYSLICELTELDQLILCAAKHSSEHLSRDAIFSICRYCDQSEKIILMSLARLVRFGYLQEWNPPPNEPRWLKHYRYIRDTPPLRNSQNIRSAIAPAMVIERHPAADRGREKWPKKIGYQRDCKRRRLAQTYEGQLTSLEIDLLQRMEQGRTISYNQSPPSDLFAALLKDLHNHRQAYSLFRTTSESDVRQAEDKFNRMLHSANIPERTARGYRRCFEEAQAEFGNGLIGLLPKTKLRGRRCPRLPADVMGAIRVVLESAVRNRWSRTTAYARLTEECYLKKINPPSRDAFGERYKKAMAANGIDWKQDRQIKRRTTTRPRTATPSLDSLPALIADLRTMPRTEVIESALSESEIEVAIAKFKQMIPGQETALTDGTLRNYRMLFIASEEKFGNGLIGLLPKTINQANCPDRLPAGVFELTNNIIDEAIRGNWKKAFAYAELRHRCKLNGLIPLAQSSFYNRFNKATNGLQKPGQEKRGKYHEHTGEK